MADGVPTWEEVARDYGRFLYTVAYRLAGNDDDAQDLVQEALIRVRRGLERYEPGSLEGWLARIVTNVFLDEVRRKRRRPTSALPDDPEWVLPPSPAGTRIARRRGVIRNLPKLPREAPSSKSTAEDGHVVAIDRACVRHRAVIVNHYLWQPTQLEPFAFGTTPVASHSRAFAT